MVKEFPLVILDGAHNPHGAMALAQFLQSGLQYERLILVLAILNDKDVEGILRILVPLASFTILTQNQNPRCASPGSLGAHLKLLDADFVVEEDLVSAIKLALDCARSRDLVCITGSLYTVGEAREYLINQKSNIKNLI